MLCIRRLFDLEQKTLKIAPYHSQAACPRPERLMIVIMSREYSNNPACFRKLAAIDRRPAPLNGSRFLCNVGIQEEG